MDKLLRKKYYYIKCNLDSALAIGCGKESFSDKDIILNGLGKPYIPASSLTGIYASLLPDEKTRSYYFGDIKDGNKGDESKSSRILTYNGDLIGEEYCVSVRENVGLDEYKTAIKGAKFNYQILEPGISFVTYMEVNQFENDKESVRTLGDEILEYWCEHGISLGGKTARGLGKLSVNPDDIRIVEFDFEDEEAVNSWLDFDMYNEKDYENSKYGMELVHNKIIMEEKSPKNGSTRIKLKLNLVGPISIREYTTKVSKVVEPDYSHMYYTRKENNEIKLVPYIPGTSWAGAFHRHMLNLDAECLKEYFGANAKCKSRISFSESEIIGASSKVRSRNAIDRFTAGTVKGALYTEQIFYGGTTELEIKITDDMDSKFVNALTAAIVDLHMGFLSVGGETSIGHGIFEIHEVLVDGKDIECDLKDANALYRKLKEKLEQRIGGASNV